MPVDPEDLELIRQLRVEWRSAFQEGIDIRDKKGYVDSEAREKCQRIDTELNKKTDEVIAAQNKRIDEQDIKIKGLMERSSRPPGAGGGGTAQDTSLARMLVESEQFKGCSFTGRFQMQVTLKTRIRPDLKQVGTIVTGGTTQIIPPVGAYPIFPYRVGLVPQQFPPAIMRDVVPVIPLDGTNAVEYVTENWTLNADYQLLEGDRKAQSGVQYTDHTAAVRTIAHFVKVSRQMAADVPFIMATIQMRLGLGVMLKEDREILYGDNTAGHLWGLMPQATPATVYYPAPHPATDQVIDQLNAAESYVESQFYFPTAFILNPMDESLIEGMKTSFGTYLLGDRAPREDGLLRIWGLPVLTTPVMNRGDYLVGQFPGTCALFDRETLTVEIAFQNEDDFVRNLITIRAEERVAFAVFVPKAFASGPFIAPPIVAAPGGLEAPPPAESAYQTRSAQPTHTPIQGKETKK
jgi:Phage capsid family